MGDIGDAIAGQLLFCESMKLAREMADRSLMIFIANVLLERDREEIDYELHRASLAALCLLDGAK